MDPEPLRLYIVRHGETDYNLNGFFQGTSDIPLNKNGIAQAEQIADTLSGIQFTAAFHSPLIRAKTTCEAILRGRLTSQADARLTEVYFGLWEGMHRDEIRQRWPEQFENYYSSIGDFIPPEGETLPDARDRVCGFYEELMERHMQGDLLIVGHQFINALLCTCIMGQEIAQAWDYRAKPGDIFIFENDGESICCTRMG